MSTSDKTIEIQNSTRSRFANRGSRRRDRVPKAKKHSEQSHHLVTLISGKLLLFLWIIQHSSGIIGKRSGLLGEASNGAARVLHRRSVILILQRTLACLVLSLLVSPVWADRILAEKDSK